MTKITKQVQVLREVPFGVICDLCQQRADLEPRRDDPKPFQRWEGSPNFATCRYDTGFDIWEPIEINYETGTRYPEGGMVERLTIDLCPKCFRNRFLKWFVDQGGIIPLIQESDH